MHFSLECRKNCTPTLVYTASLVICVTRGIRGSKICYTPHEMAKTNGYCSNGKGFYDLPARGTPKTRNLYSTRTCTWYVGTQGTQCTVPVPVPGTGYAGNCGQPHRGGNTQAFTTGRPSPPPRPRMRQIITEKHIHKTKNYREARFQRVVRPNPAPAPAVPSRASNRFLRGLSDGASLRGSLLPSSLSILQRYP
jgi:hypothetical protein